MSRAVRAFLILLAAAFFCYGGIRIASLGFYLDDWILLSYMRFAPTGFFSAMAGLLSSNKAFWFRPLGPPLYAALYALFGLQTLGWQAALLLTNVTMAFAAGRIMLRYGISERIAVLGALLFLVWPDKDATMFWPLAINNSLSLLAMLTAYLSHLEYVESGRRRFLGISVALTLISMGLYDQCAFFFLFWPVTPVILKDGVSPRAKRGALAAAAATGIFLLYKFVFVPVVLDIHFNKTFVFSASHFVWTYAAGLESAVGFRIVAFSFRSLLMAFEVSPFVAVAAALFPWIILKLPDAEPQTRRDAAWALVGLGALIFLFGYLPIAVSDYSPTPINHGNRVNEVPVLGLILAMIGIATRTMEARLLERRACALASILLAVHVGLAGFWVESYRRQNQVRQQILANLDRWPSGKTLLLLLPERYVAGKVPVFDAHYDITGAIQIWTGDRTRHAETITPRMVVAPDGVFTAFGKLPYKSCLLLDSARGIFRDVSYRIIAFRAPKT